MEGCSGVLLYFFAPKKLKLEPEVENEVVLAAAANMDAVAGLAAACGDSDENENDGLTFSLPNATAYPGTPLLSSLPLVCEDWFSSFCTLAAPSDGAMLFWEECCRLCWELAARPTGAQGVAY